jgi:hypothetical protein
MMNSFQDNRDHDKIEGTRIHKKVQNDKIENVTCPFLPVLVQYSKVQATVPYHIIGLRRTTFKHSYG